MGCEARKLPAAGEIFFLTSAFIELIGKGAYGKGRASWLDRHSKVHAVVASLTPFTCETLLADLRRESPACVILPDVFPHLTEAWHATEFPHVSRRLVQLQHAAREWRENFPCPV